MFAVYITHSQVKIDPNMPVPKWGLSDIGNARARTAATQPWAATLTRVISSDETKAIETAGLIASAAAIPVDIVDGMHENDRSATGFRGGRRLVLCPPDRKFSRLGTGRRCAGGSSGRSKRHLMAMTPKSRSPSLAMAASAPC